MKDLRFGVDWIYENGKKAHGGVGLNRIAQMAISNRIPDITSFMLDYVYDASMTLKNQCGTQIPTKFASEAWQVCVHSEAVS